MRNWDDHRLILSLHRFGTLRATGDALGVTHTTIARRLAALNESEPTRLFTRQGRAYVATDYGLERVALAMRMEELDGAATRLKRGSGDGLSGPLSLSVPQAILKYVLIDTVRDFVADNPAIDLTIVGTDSVVDLDRGDADIVIRGHASPPDHLIGRKLCTVGIHYYAHKDYLRTTPPKQRQWIASQTDVPWIADSPFPDCPIGLVAHDIQSRYLALERGLGLSRAACFMADANPDLVRLSDQPPTQIYGIWALTHPDLRGTPKVKALMQSLSEALMSARHSIQGNLLEQA